MFDINDDRTNCRSFVINSMCDELEGCIGECWRTGEENVYVPRYGKVYIEHWKVCNGCAIIYNHGGRSCGGMSETYCVCAGNINENDIPEVCRKDWEEYYNEDYEDDDDEDD